jgi:hypothetical protein
MRKEVCRTSRQANQIEQAKYAWPSLGHFLLYKNRELFAVETALGPATKCPAQVGDFFPPGELGAR